MGVGRYLISIFTGFSFLFQCLLASSSNFIHNLYTTHRLIPAPGIRDLCSPDTRIQAGDTHYVPLIFHSLSLTDNSVSVLWDLDLSFLFVSGVPGRPWRRVIIKGLGLLPDRVSTWFSSLRRSTPLSCPWLWSTGDLRSGVSLLRVILTERWWHATSQSRWHSLPWRASPKWSPNRPLASLSWVYLWDHLSLIFSFCWPWANHSLWDLRSPDWQPRNRIIIWLNRFLKCGTVMIFKNINIIWNVKRHERDSKCRV